MKTLITIFNHPLTVLLSSLIGAAAMVTLQENTIDALGWFVPCLAIILADLVTGIRAAHYRGEIIRKSRAIRATIDKCISYGSWIIACVACNFKFETQWCTWVGIGIIFFVEGISFLGNIMEPRGYKINVAGIIRIIEKKSKIDGLNEVIKKNDKV